MATVNKNFKVKNGLVVEGSTATVAGKQVLTQDTSDQYIIDLIGGETLVTSVEATQMEVIDGELNIKSGVFDESGAAAAAQAAAATDATTKANNAKSGAEATASADATSKANAAQAAAEATASADATSKANAARTAAEATAAADATTKANNAKSGAEATASADATTKAATAKSEAIAAAATDATTKAANAKSEAISAAASDATTKANAALSSAQGYTDTAVSNLVNGAPELLNTLDELAQALGDAPDTITNLTTSIGNKLPLAGGTMSGAIAMGTSKITGLGTPTATADAATKGYVDGEISTLDTAAQGYASAAQAAAELTAAGAATDAANLVAGDLSDHEAATEAHGATGAVVGTTNTQTLTNKTIGDTLNFTGAGAMTINSDSHIVLTPAAGSSVKWGADVLATQAYVDGQDTDDIAEGATNLYFSNARAIAAVGGTIGDAINDLDTDDIEEGSTNLYFTNSRALSATSAAYDAAGSASAADTSARGYADSLAVNYDEAGAAFAAYGDAVAAAALDATDKANAAQAAAELTASNALTTAVGNLESYADTAEQDAKNYADSLATNYDPAGSASTAQSNAEDYADGLINDASNLSTEVWSAYKTSTEIGLAQAAAELHADNAVSALVGSAPALLDTLQELAAALDNDPDAINSLQDIAAGKQDALTAGSNINITGATISVTGLDAADISDFNTAALSATSAAYDVAGAASAADTSARGYADSLASNYDAAGSAASAETDANTYADGLTDNMLNGTTSFTSLNVNDQAKQIAASSTGTASVAGTSYEWAKADYRSAKLLVKIDNGTDNEMSEILITLDSTDNVAITEYAIVGTNGSRGTISADVSGANVRVRVTPTNNSTIKVTGTLLK